MSFMDVLGLPSLTFKLCLHCATTETREAVNLPVSEDLLDHTVHILKLLIENQHNIPACCQMLTFGACILEDQHLMSHYYLRNGDSFVVTFCGKGDVKEILAGLDHLRETYHWMKASERNLREVKLSTEALDEIHRRKCQRLARDLCDNYLSSANNQSQVNNEFLVDCGGLVILRKLHEELLKYPTANLPYDLLVMEKGILEFYWDFTVDATIFLLCANLKCYAILQRIFCE